MPLKFNIISNIDNGYGLQRDYAILRGFLENMGHEVCGIHFQRAEKITFADVNIFLETIIPVFRYAKQNWYFPNPEYFETVREGRFIGSLTRILCKTDDAFNVFQQITQKAEYVGFQSLDMFMPQVPRKPEFLHVAGKSLVKNTEPIIYAWAKYKIPHKLTLVSRLGHHCAILPPNITCIQRVGNNGAFAELMNAHQYHICASEYEGWGHCIHESMGVGAVVLTTDAPPMNESGITEHCLIPSRENYRLRYARMHRIKPTDVAAAVMKVVEMDELEKAHEMGENRRRFKAANDNFRERFGQIIRETESRFMQ